MADSTKWATVGKFILKIIFIAIFVAGIRYCTTHDVTPTAPAITSEQATPPQPTPKQTQETPQTTKIISAPQANAPPAPIYDEQKYLAIKAQAQSTYDAYASCYNKLNEYTAKIGAVRDQGTLYQWDGNVNDCTKEYLSRAKILTELVQRDASQITPDSRATIRQGVISEVSTLRTLATRYGQLSSSSHYGIHRTYQTNALIDLVQLIGTTTGAVSNGNAADTITSLGDLYDWWYYNGGVIDTGWGQ